MSFYHASNIPLSLPSILHYTYFAIPHFFTLFIEVLTDNVELQLSTYAAQTIFLHRPLLK